ncbi:MAG: hypothetical protein C4527_14985 [Candidatus Omnitrophota bacterium]|jgi:hypothetical protein|nr:MAG: hypothetical protein C4527_14985 [Candidatus Omnitrophota bacterium]
MKKSTLALISLLIVLCLLFVWAQNKILNYRTWFRVEEKILMISDRPEITKIAAMGFDGLVADLLWIRGIQYFGGNFSTLDKPEKRSGMMNLLRNLVGLDPHFLAAYQFGGFIINESIKDHEQAIDFLLDGADNNPLTEYPSAWRLPFDAGFIAFYQLKDHDVAKELFLQSIYGKKFAAVSVENAEGVKDDDSPEWLIDGDPFSSTRFDTSDGVFSLNLHDERQVGRVTVQQDSKRPKSYQLSYAADASMAAWQTLESVTNPGFYFHDFEPALKAHAFRFDQFKIQAEEDEEFSIAEVKIFGPRNPATPSYVERMAYEMDRAAGRFKAALDQYMRYYDEAVKKGDQVSADLSLQKLFDIYTNKCIEILQETAELYLQEKGSLPTAQMFELIQEGYLSRIIQQKITEEPGFVEDVAPVLMPTGNVWEILTTWDQKDPHLLITYTNDLGEEDWYITSRTRLIAEQKGVAEKLQQFVNKYKEEKGTLPENLSDLLNEPWFGATRIYEDPMGGEFFINRETGQVEARNPKY